MRYTRIVIGAIVALIFVSTSSIQAQLFSRKEPCDTTSLFAEARERALAVPVVHDSRVVSFFEKFIYPRSIELKKRTDFAERTIPIVFLNSSTCELSTHTLTRTVNGTHVPTVLSTDDGQFIVLVEGRAYGVLWNWWNTPFHVLAPEGWVVAAVHWKPLTGEDSFAYSPESSDLPRAFPWLPEAGRVHFRQDNTDAMNLLAHVPSLGVRAKTVPQVMQEYFPRLLESIVTIEQTDEYQIAEYFAGRVAMNPFDRPFIVLAANPDKGFAYTRSPAGAQGLMQVMPTTCAEVRGNHPSAPIPSQCIGEDHGHPVEIASAALVIDYHLSILYNKLARKDETPEQFAMRPEMPMLLRASYNTGPSRVATAVRTRKNWADMLLAETRGYLVKALGFDGASR